MLASDMADIDRLRAENPLPDVAASFGIDLQKDGHEFVSCCPFHQEDTPSFTLFVGKGGEWRYQCFGCSEGGDVLDFVQKIKGVDFKEALKILGGEVRRENIAPRAAASVKDIYADIKPLPPVAELQARRRVKLWNAKRDKFGTITPSMVFPYRAQDGALIGYVLRHDLKDGGKETPMVMWCRLPDGSEEWCRYPFPKPRPLFGLDRLEGGKQVIIAEGEKCATVGAAVTGRCFISWAGGTHGVNHADWSPLAGRSVVIWPDADAPGAKAAHDIALRLAEMGCAVKVLDVSGKPKGWDVADASDEGWTRGEIDGFMRDRARVFDPNWSQPEYIAPPLAEVSPVPVEDGRAGGEYDEAGDWIPETYEAYGEIEMDRSSDLIEYDHDKRRETPASGRAGPHGHYRVWGGDVDQLREWAFLGSDAVFVNVHTGEVRGRTAFDLTMVNVTPIVEVLDGKGETKNLKLPPSQCLVQFCDGLVCSTTMYRPDCPDMLIWVDGILHLNSFLPSSVPNMDPDWERRDAWRAAKDHIENVVPDGAATIIQWLAHNVQFPGKKILWAPVIVGEQGDGKTTIGRIVQVAMGRKNVSPVSQEALFSDFTSWAEGRCVRVLEEIRVHDKGRSSVMDKLKPMITNDVVDVVKKNKDGADVANVTNYMALTNFIDALAIDEGDRRWAVWKTRFTDRSQVLREMGDDYWHRLHDGLNNYPEVIRGWLMSVDLSDFNPYSAPGMTQAKMDMIEASRPAKDADTREAMALGGFGVGPDVLATDCLGEIMRSMGARTASTSAMSNILKGLDWVRFDHPIKWRDKPRRVYYKPGDWSDVEPEVLREIIRGKLDDTDITGAVSSYW